MLGAVESVGGGLVDGDGDRLGRRVRAVAAVDGDGFDLNGRLSLGVVVGENEV